MIQKSLKKNGDTDQEDTRKFNKELEDIRHKPTEINNTITEMKNTLEVSWKIKECKSCNQKSKNKNTFLEMRIV